MRFSSISFIYNILNHTISKVIFFLYFVHAFDHMYPDEYRALKIELEIGRSVMTSFKKISMCIFNRISFFLSLSLTLFLFLSFFFILDRFDYFEIIYSIIFVRKFFSSHLHVTIKTTSIVKSEKRNEAIHWIATRIFVASNICLRA